jgi:hypothetical protein
MAVNGDLMDRHYQLFVLILKISGIFVARIIILAVLFVSETHLTIKWNIGGLSLAKKMRTTI